jgi:hypothetical protein
VNSSGKGSAAERFVRQEEEANGYLAGSRRHIPGAGDEIFVHPEGHVKLVEIKGYKDKCSPYNDFGPQKRQEMRETLLPLGGSRWLAVVRGSGKNRYTEWFHEAKWP